MSTRQHPAVRRSARSTHQVKLDVVGQLPHLLRPRRQPLLQIAELAPRRLQLLARDIAVFLSIRQRLAQLVQGLERAAGRKKRR